MRTDREMTRGSGLAGAEGQGAPSASEGLTAAELAVRTGRPLRELERALFHLLADGFVVEEAGVYRPTDDGRLWGALLAEVSLDADGADG